MILLFILLFQSPVHQKKTRKRNYVRKQKTQKKVKRVTKIEVPVRKNRNHVNIKRKVVLPVQIHLVDIQNQENKIHIHICIYKCMYIMYPCILHDFEIITFIILYRLFYF